MDRLEDTRNLVDELKGRSNEEVREILDETRNELEIAIYNVQHDFNMGSIVRTANNFNVRAVHIIGKKKYNRRGAMCTDKYLHIYHWKTVAEFLENQNEYGREVIAIENNTLRAKPLSKQELPENATLLFGSEDGGLSPELLEAAEAVYYIESFGSTRSVNVGVAAGIAMYEWTRQNVLATKKRE